MSKKYGKLVRDNIPAVIIANGEKPITRVLDNQEYLYELIQKLKEETAEFEADHSLAELADTKEVTIAIREALGYRAGDLEEARRQKANKNGRFRNKIYLEGLEQ